MPHWTPKGSDKVVYTTVSEAYSGSVDDYLLEFTRDLHIGEGEYPKYILVGGDQQTYAIIKKTKTNILINMIGCTPYPEIGIS